MAFTVSNGGKKESWEVHWARFDQMGNYLRDEAEFKKNPQAFAPKIQAAFAVVIRFPIIGKKRSAGICTSVFPGGSPCIRAKCQKTHNFALAKALAKAREQLDYPRYRVGIVAQKQNNLNRKNFSSGPLQTSSALSKVERASIAQLRARIPDLTAPALKSFTFIGPEGLTTGLTPCVPQNKGLCIPQRRMRHIKPQILDLQKTNSHYDSVETDFLGWDQNYAESLIPKGLI